MEYLEYMILKDIYDTLLNDYENNNFDYAKFQDFLLDIKTYDKKLHKKIQNVKDIKSIDSKTIEEVKKIRNELVYDAHQNGYFVKLFKDFDELDFEGAKIFNFDFANKIISFDIEFEKVKIYKKCHIILKGVSELSMTTPMDYSKIMNVSIDKKNKYILYTVLKNDNILSEGNSRYGMYNEIKLNFSSVKINRIPNYEYQNHFMESLYKLDKKTKAKYLLQVPLINDLFKNKENEEYAETMKLVEKYFPTEIFDLFKKNILSKDDIKNLNEAIEEYNYALK